jgi:hypothetical protein
MDDARHLDDAKKLAGEFRRQIQGQRDLLGFFNQLEVGSVELSSLLPIAPHQLAANALQGFR